METHEHPYEESQISLVGLVFPAIAMASLFLYLEKNKIL